MASRPATKRAQNIAIFRRCFDEGLPLEKAIETVAAEMSYKLSNARNSYRWLSTRPEYGPAAIGYPAPSGRMTAKAKPELPAEVAAVLAGSDPEAKAKLLAFIASELKPAPVTESEGTEAEVDDSSANESELAEMAARVS